MYSTEKKLKVTLDEYAIMPERAHETDAGLDLFAPYTFCVPAGTYAFVNTGVHVELPHMTRGHICSKSGLNRDYGITCDGTIDEGYTGPIGVVLHNGGDQDHWFDPGDKVAQMVIERVIYPEPVLVDVIGGGERGDNGFGSTGE